MSRQPSESWQQWQQWQAAASGDSASFVSLDDDSRSFMTMQEIDPSPIDSPIEIVGEEEEEAFEETEKKSSSAPVDSDKKPALQRSGTFGSLGLSGNSHGSIYYLSRIQKYSSYTFSIYTVMHIANTSIIPLITKSINDSDKYLLLTRPYYQSFPMEPLLIVIPIIAHVGSGLAMRIIRRNQNLQRYGAHSLSPSVRMQTKQRIWPTVSWNAISGYLLAPLVFGHAFVNRILPLWVDGGSSGVGLGFVAHGFAKHPFVANAGYSALVATFCGHVVWGIAKYQGLTPVGNGEMGSQGRTGKRRWWAINITSLALTALWLAGGLGVVGRGGLGTGWVAQLWDDIYARVPLLSL